MRTDHAHARAPPPHRQWRVACPYLLMGPHAPPRSSGGVDAVAAANAGVLHRCLVRVSMDGRGREPHIDTANQGLGAAGMGRCVCVWGGGIVSVLLPAH